MYDLPLLLDLYTAKKFVVVRGSQKVCNLVQDERYMEYSTVFRDAHKKAIERIELARFLLEEWLAAQQEAQFPRLHEMFAKVQAGTGTTACDVDEPEPKSSKHVLQACTALTVLAAKVACCIFADAYSEADFS